MAEIVFYFDCASAFSYIGFEFMERYREIWNVKVDYRPFYLDKVMAQAKNSFSPNKLPYLFTDLRRTSDITKIPFKGTPLKYPYDPTAALRTLQYLKTRHPENDNLLMRQAMRLLWRMEYVECTAPESVDDVKKALEGLIAPETIDKAQTVADTLEPVVQNTSVLQKMRAFGAPTILVYKKGSTKPQMFFGSDRFEHIAIHLGEQFLPMKQLFANSKI
ncbi:Glutathione S-transferase kappa 1 [Coemansia sp. RSA 1813]|nr:Glutathione S-transferase kappa 1 [Coemansia sp. RSA 1646]KAJ1771794.1 Glutathione S-transferase kappa 1 [Coemansia sp. RSA 1843]KAJ2090759.1 Glutathione S-transferase kappa 1 [Coemansia sp. RSA 986]KAJ2216009.1 Glutathione S-transferase kappa 1 [Coemansia sp. RSA 487]KAJ2570422.1 Glutathione S-transferase kappa 1 [Coemansia sp. RSA 1813]